MIISYTIRDKNGKIISADNNNLLLPPASNMKILSSYYSYYNLGVNYSFKTIFRVFNGSLTIEGDPLFLFNDKEFERVILNEAGKLSSFHFENSFITKENYHPDWTIEDIKHCYGTRVTPFAINENCEPIAHGSEKSKPVSQMENYSRILRNFNNLNADKGEKIKYYEIEIGKIISHILERSCNFSAELLMRYTSSKSMNKKIGWIDSAKMVKKLFLDLGIENDSMMVRDGSGLSRFNLISTSVLSRISYIIFNSNPEFYNYYPSPGNGTLKKRLQDMNDYDIKAKTGTISYISSLTGISRTNKLIFSIIVYGLENEEERERAIDNLLAKLLEKG